MNVEGLACFVCGARQSFVAVNFTDQHSECRNGMPVALVRGCIVARDQAELAKVLSGPVEANPAGVRPWWHLAAHRHHAAETRGVRGPISAGEARGRALHGPRSSLAMLAASVSDVVAARRPTGRPLVGLDPIMRASRPLEDLPGVPVQKIQCRLPLLPLRRTDYLPVAAHQRLVEPLGAVGLARGDPRVQTLSLPKRCNTAWRVVRRF
jgi:hypothetical protein